MQSPKCGFENADNSKFCNECGQKPDGMKMFAAHNKAYRIVHGRIG